ncbi:hypothetical protein JCM10295v2_002716 [Rhodotorula toruloides]
MSPRHRLRRFSRRAPPPPRAQPAMRRAAATAVRTALSARPLATRQAPVVLPLPRSFSSSSTSQFFFRRPQKTRSQLRQELLDAAAQGKPEVVGKLYPQFAQLAHPSTDPSERPRLWRKEAQVLLRLVAQAGHFHTALRIFNDLEALYDSPPQLAEHQLLLLAMVNSNRHAKAVEWIESLENSYGLRPESSDWNVVLQGFRQKGDVAGMLDVLRRMRSNGATPDLATYNTLIAGFLAVRRLDLARSTIQEMEADGVQPNLATSTTLLVGFLDAGELASAREVHGRLLGTAALPSRLSSKGKGKEPDRGDGQVMVDIPVVNALMRYEAVVNGLDAALSFAERCRDNGVPLDAYTINTLVKAGVREIRTADGGARLVERLEVITGAQSDRRTWSILVSHLARGEGNVDEALKIYYMARDRSVEPDSAMVQPLLDALLRPVPTTETLAQAKVLYEDLVSGARSYREKPDSGIFAVLLRACAHQDCTDLDWSLSLVQDMRDQSVRLDPLSVGWHIVAMMRAAPSFEDAFKAYDEMRALDPSVLDAKAYNTILHAFTTLRADTGEAAPSAYINEFLTDMIRSGHPPESATYSLLLQHYSRIAEPSIEMIKQLHSRIKLDANLDPDTPLFNSLMDAYSRVGAFDRAYGVWDSMLLNLSGRIKPDQISVSILLDTCGRDPYMGGRQRGRRLWQDLERETLPVVRNYKIWESWVEALCRWGMFDEAEKVVFEEMGRPPANAVGTAAQVAPKPTVATVEMLLKFARWTTSNGEERARVVAKRIKAELPELWERLPAGAKSLARSQGQGGVAGVSS